MGILDGLLIYGLVKSVIKASEAKPTDYSTEIDQHLANSMRRSEEEEKIAHERRILEAKRELLEEQERYKRIQQRSQQQNAALQRQVTMVSRTNQHDAERDIYRAMPMVPTTNTSGRIVKCNRCGNKMDAIVADTTGLCLYCGSKRLVPSSEHIEAVRMQNGAYVGVEISKHENYKEIALAREKTRQQENQLDFVKSIIPAFVLISLIIGGLICLIILLLSD